MRGTTRITRNGTAYWYAQINGKRHYCGKDKQGRELAEETRAKWLVEKKKQKKLGLVKQAKGNGAGKYLYFIQQGAGGEVKIGIADDPERRMKELQTGNPKQLLLLGKFDGARLSERLLHRRFGLLRSHGEWFHPDPALLVYIEELHAS